MADTEPKWRRRKTARPGEIVAAALATFIDKGYAAAKLDEIAARAGVSKAALYLYFETKEDLFRAVAEATTAPAVAIVRGASQQAQDAPVAVIIPMMLSAAAGAMSTSRAPAIVRMVISESRAFPELARRWEEDVIGPMLDLLAGMLERGQAKGEIAPGDPRLQAFSIIGPLGLGMLFREVFGDAGGRAPDLAALAAQHAQTVLGGLRPQASKDTN